MKSKKNKEQSIRFLIGGTINTLLSYTIYWTLLLLLVPYTIAYTTSYVTTIVSGFIINTYFVFKEKWSWRKFLSFPLIHVANYFTSISIIWIFVEKLNTPKEISPIIATIIVFPISFFMTKLLIQWKIDKRAT